MLEQGPGPRVAAPGLRQRVLRKRGLGSIQESPWWGTEVDQRDGKPEIQEGQRDRGQRGRNRDAAELKGLDTGAPEGQGDGEKWVTEGQGGKWSQSPRRASVRGTGERSRGAASTWVR